MICQKVIYLPCIKVSILVTIKGIFWYSCRTSTAMTEFYTYFREKGLYKLEKLLQPKHCKLHLSCFGWKDLAIWTSRSGDFLCISSTYSRYGTTRKKMLAYKKNLKRYPDSSVQNHQRGNQLKKREQVSSSQKPSNQSSLAWLRR